MKPTLTELAAKYSSDKLYWHSYIPKYEELFAGMQVKRLLEIGIGYRDLMQPFLPAGMEYVHGSSLKMFEEYFPEANIFACDIRPDTLINEGRIRSTTCDQSSPFSLGCMMGELGFSYDVIIDDGSHIHDHQRITLAVLLRFLKPGGVWVTEDVWPEAGVKLAAEFGGQLWMGEKGRDDNLVIIRK